MINLTPVWITLMLELIAGFSLLIVAFVIVKARRKTKDHQAADQFISELNKNLSASNQELAKTLTTEEGVSTENLATFLTDIKDKEKVLYHSIIELFLSKDRDVLKQVDQRVHGLSSAFCNLLSHTSRNKQNESDQTASESLDLQQKVSQLEQENNTLTDELARATSMLNNLSADYTRNFREKKSAESTTTPTKTQKAQTPIANTKKPVSNPSLLEEL
ncbi:MAG: hypothetical protein V3U75_02285 [Methylococcaceae bacterium]